MNNTPTFDLRRKLSLALAAAALVLPMAASAQTPGAPTPNADGEIRKIDKAQAKITLKHGPIANLGMSGMTMVFKVADPTMLTPLKAGDKVRFAAEDVNGVLTVTAIQTVN